MLTSVERDDSYGGRDLYVSFKQGKTWSEPKNIGNDINTAADDFSPWLGEDNKTLYYSTSGISGYGGADIYVTIRLDDTWERWSEPENLGSSVNSKEDDSYFSIPSSGKHIYFARGTIDDDTDIFRFKADDIFLDKDSPLMASVGHLTSKKPDQYFATLVGRTIDIKTEEIIPNVHVVVERLPDGFDVGQAASDSLGEFMMSVRGGARYGLLAKHPGYLSADENFDFNKLEVNDTVHVDLKLAKIEVGAKIVIKNVFFDFDKAELKTSSYPVLNRLLEYMLSGEIQKVEISGHTDSYGKDDYNQKLSQRRVNSVKAFLRQNGITEDRMIAKGYGESQPAVSNDTPENRAKNRRVEFKILE
jgi:outer membrane protein OmpA-like peptidoglycan-associated protein